VQVDKAGGDVAVAGVDDGFVFVGCLGLRADFRDAAGSDPNLATGDFAIGEEECAAEDGGLGHVTL